MLALTIVIPLRAGQKNKGEPVRDISIRHVLLNALRV